MRYLRTWGGVRVRVRWPHRLLPHRALVRVAGRLIVVRVRDEPRHRPQEAQRLDLDVSGFHGDVLLVDRDVGTVLLVHVEVLQSAVPH